MTYEEKRELRLQISQLLADAGLNQAVIKQIVEEEIRHKVDRAIEQVIKSLDAQCSSGHYVENQIRKLLDNKYLNQRAFNDVVKEELKNRVIEVTLRDVKNVMDDGLIGDNKNA